MKPVKYFAIRVGGMVVIRRTSVGLQRVRSKLYRPNAEFALTQVSWTGGKVIGSLPYRELVNRVGIQITDNNCAKVSVDTVRGLRPFMIKGA